MHFLANPARFLEIARPATAWLLWPGLVLMTAGILGGLTLSSPDYLQGETVRIRERNPASKLRPPPRRPWFWPI